MSAQGYTVAALDCRGQGGLSEDNSDVVGNTHRGHIIRGLADALAGRPEAAVPPDLPRHRATGAHRHGHAGAWMRRAWARPAAARAAH
jgi:alpha-beta hydrolase superfamily lysophospholipase